MASSHRGINCTGSDEELSEKMQNFNGHIAEQKRKKASLDDRRQDLEEELNDKRSAHSTKTREHGQLAAEAKVRVLMA